MNPFKFFSGNQSTQLPTVKEMEKETELAIKDHREALLKQYTESIMNNPVVMVGGGGGGSGGGGGGHGGVYVSDSTQTRRVQQHSSFNDPYSVSITNDLWRARMLSMRLRLSEGQALPFQHISTGLGGDHVFVFLVHNGEPVTLRDDAAMFPSDTLITQLRLLLP